MTTPVNPQTTPLSRAREGGQPGTRRERQLLQIAALVAAGDTRRAAGLALEHVAVFPSDADLVQALGGEGTQGRRS